MYGYCCTHTLCFLRTDSTVFVIELFGAPKGYEFRANPQQPTSDQPGRPLWYQVDSPAEGRCSPLRGVLDRTVAVVQWETVLTECRVSWNRYTDVEVIPPHGPDLVNFLHGFDCQQANSNLSGAEDYLSATWSLSQRRASV